MMAPALTAEAQQTMQWWLPTSGAHAFFTIMNVDAAGTVVSPAITFGGRTWTGRPFALGPFESRQVSLPDLVDWIGETGSPVVGDGSSGFVSFRAATSEARLLAHAVCVDEAVGFSVSPTVHTAAARPDAELQTPGVPLGLAAGADGFPEGTEFSRASSRRTSRASRSI